MSSALDLPMSSEPTTSLACMPILWSTLTACTYSAEPSQKSPPCEVSKPMVAAADMSAPFLDPTAFAVLLL